MSDGGAGGVFVANGVVVGLPAFALAIVILLFAEGQCEGSSFDFGSCFKENKDVCKTEINDCTNDDGGNFAIINATCACETMLNSLLVPNSITVVNTGLFFLGILLGPWLCSVSSFEFASSYNTFVRPFLNAISALWRVALYAGLTCISSCQGDLKKGTKGLVVGIVAVEIIELAIDVLCIIAMCCCG
jgi:hypothetical protein